MKKKKSAKPLLKEMKGIRKDLKHHEVADEKYEKSLAKHEAEEAKSMKPKRKKRG